MKLFDIVPSNFFSVLSSSNKEIYFDALMILHEMFKTELNIRLDDYLAYVISILEDRAFEAEHDDGVQEESLTASGKARLILDRFIKTGWVDKEFMDHTFIEIITPRSYAVPVLKLLSELGNDTLKEYNSLVFATFSGLKQALSEEKPHMYEALLSAQANTEQLQYALRTLYHSIREFLRNVEVQQDVNLLLQDHFDTYKQLSDQIYHPIKTMDSVHRYKSPIQLLLLEILSNQELIQSVRERAMAVKKYDDESDVENEIIQMIDYVMDAYQNLGNLVSEIDRKHSAFTKSSIEKIQYLMTADQTIKGKLVEILKTYTALEGDKKEQLICIMESHIQANRQEFLEEKSLYHKNVKSRRIEREPLEVDMDDDFGRAAEGYLLQQIKNSYPSARVRAFIDGLFTDGQTQITANNIPLFSENDFILLILAVIRRNEQDMPYGIEIGNSRIENNGYHIPDMIINKTRAVNHV